MLNLTSRKIKELIRKDVGPIINQITVTEELKSNIANLESELARKKKALEHRELDDKNQIKSIVELMNLSDERIVPTIPGLVSYFNLGFIPEKDHNQRRIRSIFLYAIIHENENQQKLKEMDN